jgi:hypothetical protein
MKFSAVIAIAIVVAATVATIDAKPSRFRRAVVQRRAPPTEGMFSITPDCSQLTPKQVENRVFCNGAQKLK